MKNIEEFGNLDMLDVQGPVSGNFTSNTPRVGKYTRNTSKHVHVQNDMRKNRT